MTCVQILASELFISLSIRLHLCSDLKKNESINIFFMLKAFLWLKGVNEFGFKELLPQKSVQVLPLIVQDLVVSVVCPGRKYLSVTTFWCLNGNSFF